MVFSHGICRIQINSRQYDSFSVTLSSVVCDHKAPEFQYIDYNYVSCQTEKRVYSKEKFKNI